MVIDDVIAKFGGQLLFGQRHTDRGRHALPQRPGRHLDTLGVTILGMARGFCAELAEVLDLLDCHVFGSHTGKAGCRAASSRGRRKE